MAIISHVIVIICSFSCLFHCSTGSSEGAELLSVILVSWPATITPNSYLVKRIILAKVGFYSSSAYCCNDYQEHFCGKERRKEKGDL